MQLVSTLTAYLIYQESFKKTFAQTLSQTN